MTKDLPTSTRLDRDLKDALRAYAKRQGCSLSWLVQSILRQWVSWRKKQEAADVSDTEAG